ncbi:jacalin lectin family protein [Rhynchospora pubera]|uniref:Jacalin lectin family protein n=1 Tax=Rhynchospora pubera TaxID=906938 RepID=A0AAV8F250_9POAL|nr:jacalin lectin family protein [Rhynchospora pubera]
MKASASNAALKKVGPYGGDGGEIRDMDPSGITRIVKIGIRHGGAIDALIVHFERNGHEESTDLWGTDGGELTEISFEEQEYIMAVKGHVGTYRHNNYKSLRSLVLETNLRSYGPYGVEEGQSFELSAEGGEIIGFHGRSGQLLLAIGVYVKAFVKLGPLGGSGGFLKDMDPSDISRIVKIGVRHGGVIDSIVVHYERNGHVESTELWGTEEGELTEISLEANEYLIDVSGHVGIDNGYTILKSLRLQTNLRTYGPYGAEEGQYSFEFSVQGGQIIGFHARSGHFIDALGVYVKGGRAETKIVRTSGEASS